MNKAFVKLFLVLIFFVFALAIPRFHMLDRHKNVLIDQLDQVLLSTITEFNLAFIYVCHKPSSFCYTYRVLVQ